MVTKHNSISFQQQDSRAVQLPKLRDDLTLIETTADVSGQLRWQIHDTSTNKFYSIGYAAYHMFRLWSKHKLLDKLINDVNKSTTLNLSPEQGEVFVFFLIHQNLIVGTTPEHIKNYSKTLSKVRTHWLKRIVHGYLFFRFTLLRPDVFLTNTYKYVRFFYTKIFMYIVIVCGVLGLILALRQWQVFASTFLDFVSLKGAFYYFTSIVLAKITHEFSHAYTAKHYGCDVPSMGVAFLVMWPILYTDATAAWKLKSKRQRLMIDMAGIIAELTIAAFALLFWAFLPEGPLRAVCFAMATVTLISTLAVNLNFMMRFDGYYILSDALGFDNMQTRSFFIGKWKMRNIFFGINAPPPEKLTKKEYYIMVVYSYSIWVYRFFLFIGIALLVYSLFFKLLGIILFLIEVVFFLALPIYREVKVWVNMRSQIKWNHATKRLTLVIAISLILFGYPWQTKISLPAVLEPDNMTVVNNRYPGYVIAVNIKNNTKVSKGETLIELASPKIEQLLQKSYWNIEYAKQRQRITDFNRNQLANTNIAYGEEQRHIKNYEALQKQIEQLSIKAPIDGYVFDIDEAIKPGLWISKNTPLMLMGHVDSAVIYAYVSESKINRITNIKKGSTSFDYDALFIPNDIGWQSIKLKIDTLDSTNLPSLDQASLASVYGGPINVLIQSNGQLTPVESTYRMKLIPTNFKISKLSSTINGVVKLKVQSGIPAVAVFKTFVGTIIKEAGL